MPGRHGGPRAPEDADPHAQDPEPRPCVPGSLPQTRPDPDTVPSMPTRDAAPGKPRPLKMRVSGRPLARPDHATPQRRDGPAPDVRGRGADGRPRDGLAGDGAYGTPHGLADETRHAVVVTTPTRADLRRMEHTLIEGLEAAGYVRPRLELRTKPFAGLRASIERAQGGQPRRGETITLEMSDGFVEAPKLALRGLAAGLGLKVRPKRPKAPEVAHMLSDYYDEWLRGGEARDLHGRLRRARGRKQGRGPKGEVHDLDAIRDRLVDTFFGGHLDPVRLTWSSRIAYNVYGHHDPDLDTIVISRALDHPDVPRRVVAFVLYHELLHHQLGVLEGPGGCRKVHPPAFRRREERFPHHALCDAYLSAMCTRRKPVRRSRAKAGWDVLWHDGWAR